MSWKNHKKTLPRAFVVSIVITLIIYLAGIIFVDFLKFNYSIIGLLLAPFTFLLRYVLDKYWVFRENSIANDKPKNIGSAFN